MPAPVAPNGVGQKITNMTMGPIMLAPDVQTVYEYYTDDLNGEAFTFHYKTNVTRLHGRQLTLLKEEVCSQIVPGSYIGVYGLADRTGSEQVNYEVSKQRLVNFYAEMRKYVDVQLLSTPYADATYYGEDYLASVKSPDGKPSFWGRCVAIFVWPNYQSRQRVFADFPFIQFVRSQGNLK